MHHQAVLVKEILQIFEEVELHTFCDCTVGAAGHAKKILENHPEMQRFIGIDQDESALKIAKKELQPWKEKVSLFHGNFAEMDQFLKEDCIDGFLFDIGVSSMQLDTASRGFSFQREGPLDMRMDQQNKRSAKEVVNEFSEKELGEIFQKYGEERYWKKAAKEIITARKRKKIETTKELAQILRGVCKRKRRLHPATLIFQALRIFVNDELNVLQTALQKAVDRLCQKGRIVVVSFHSLEDRIVKEFFKKEKKKLRLLTKKPIRSSWKEKNKRARSAKLRAAEKL